MPVSTIYARLACWKKQDRFHNPKKFIVLFVETFLLEIILKILKKQGKNKQKQNSLIH